MRFGKIKIKVTAVGNPYAVCKSILEAVKQHSHFVGRLIVKLIGLKADGATVSKLAVGLNAKQNCLGFGIHTAQVMAVVRGDHGQVTFLGKLGKQRQDLFLLRKTVVLQFNIKIVLSEDNRQPYCNAARFGKIASYQQLRNAPCKASRERDQSLGVVFQQLHIHAGLGIKTLGK